MFVYLSLANLIKISVAFLVTNHKKISPKYLLFVLIAFIPSAYIAYGSSFFSILFFFAFLLLLSLRNDKENNLISQMVSILVPFEIVLGFILLTTPLERQIVTLDFENQNHFYFLLLEICSYTIISLLSFWASSKLIPAVFRRKKEKLALNIGLILFFFYQIYFVYKYASPYFLETVITLLVIVFGLFTYVIISTVTDKQELKLQMEQQRIEQEYMKRYAEEISWQYQELKKFKHDYINILSSLHFYIEQDDMPKLKNYFNEQLMITKNNLNQVDTYFKDLNHIESSEIKSILALKLILARDKGIPVSLEISDVISDNMPIDSVVLVRMLGIILDNSIEAVTTQKNPSIQIGFFDMDDSYLIVIKNTIYEDLKPLHLLSKEGFSTKGEHRGLGLSILKDLSDKEKNLSLETTITKKSFIQKIHIKKGEC